MKDKVSDKELTKVIADFWEMGHVDTTFEMVKQDDSPQLREVARDVLEECE